MTSTQLTYLRTGATAVITALAALYTIYPHDVWLTVVIAAAGATGIHAIPAIQQGVTRIAPISTQKGTVTMSEQPEVTQSQPEGVAQEVAPAGNPAVEIDGLALMGLRAPVTDVGQAEATGTPEPSPAPETPATAPVAPVHRTVTGVTVHYSDGSSESF